MTQLKGTTYWGAVAILVGCLLLTWQQPGVEAQAGLPPQHGGLGFGGPGGTFTGGTITSPIFLPNGTLGAPALAFASETGSGFYRHGPYDLRIGVLNTALAAFLNDSIYGNHFVLDVNNGDVWLYRDAANTLALRNLTNAQTFNWYYSHTNASNYQRGALKTSASGIEIAAETAGSGADNLDVTITPAGTGKVVVGGTASPAATDACTQWSVTVDANYIYVCTATGVWKRSALTGGY